METMDYEERNEAEALSYGIILFSFPYTFLHNVDCSESVMQCCGIIDVEGTTVSNEAKVFQALQGLYIPHSKDQHTLLPEDFPTHLLRVPLGQP